MPYRSPSGIDGNFDWCTYYGSSGTDVILDVGTVADGKLCATGITYGADLLKSRKGAQQVPGGVVDAFVLEMDTSGSLSGTLIWAGRTGKGDAV